MLKKKEVLAVIPMKGNSVSIPKKSIYPILGKPMCYYSVIEAQKTELIDRIIAYVRDPEIISVSKELGLDVVIRTPEDENGTDLDTFRCCLTKLLEKENYKPDIIVHLRATIPLREAEFLERAIRMLIENPAADSVRGICNPPLTPFKMYWMRPSGYIDYFLKEKFPDIFSKFPEPSAVGRQNFPEVFNHTGQIDVTRWTTIMEKSSMSGSKILPFFVEHPYDADIDGPEDIPYIEFLLKRYGKAPTS